MQKSPSNPRLLITSAIAMLGAFALAGCGSGGEENGNGGEAAAATAEVANGQGDSLGQVEFTFGESGTNIDVAVENLEAGFYGLHIHEIGECEPDSQAPDDSEETGDFLSAGGHIAGEEDADHPEHAGDLPTLLVNDDGTAEMSVVTDRLDETQLTDTDGAAVMIHSQPDNFANIPDRYLGDQADPDEDTLGTGDAGDRLGCGVIEG